MSIINRLKLAWDALKGEEEEPINEGHRFAIVIGENGYYADAYRINPYDGYPEWYYTGLDGVIHCRKMDGLVLKDFKPEISLEEFKKAG